MTAPVWSRYCGTTSAPDAGRSSGNAAAKEARRDSHAWGKGLGVDSLDDDRSRVVAALLDDATAERLLVAGGR